MTLYTILFYLLAVVIVAATVLAITRRNMVHAVIYLVVSFFGSALLFYLFGAPLLAALEVIIYAGAIMVLFLFIIMMLRDVNLLEKLFPLSQWAPAAVMAVIYLVVGTVLILTDPGARAPLTGAVATPRDFGRFVFENHWLAIEIVSLLLLIALVGALYLGKLSRKSDAPQSEGNP
ncbi:MAG: NADH-quinone oxidoreductase subunit J [Desulfobacterales bacterium]|jgi:NADH-quinone oxidoreductase subunit J